MNLERGDPRVELGKFLASRRARLLPSDVGLESGRRRRVAGLRREEVAVLAHISETWYARLEQGQDVKPSPEVLDAVAQALRLNADERAYLFMLAGMLLKTVSPDAPALPEAFVQAVHALVEAPAVVYGPRFDILLTNAAHRIVFGDIEDFPDARGNVVRQLFLDPARRALFPQWENVALGLLKSVRLNAGRQVGDPAFVSFIEELRSESALFREWWDRHDVVHAADGEKEIAHPVAGRLLLDHAAFTFSDRPEQLLIVYTAKPGSESDRKLRNLLRDESGAAIITTGNRN